MCHRSGKEQNTYVNRIKRNIVAAAKPEATILNDESRWYACEEATGDLDLTEQLHCEGGLLEKLSCLDGMGKRDCCTSPDL